MTSHPLIPSLLAAWRANRAEYQVYLEGQVQRAETDTNGVLLNRRGWDEGVDSTSLFMGPWVRVQAYASRELLDWFAQHGRMTFQAWEEQHGHTPGRRWGELFNDDEPEDFGRLTG